MNLLQHHSPLMVFLLQKVPSDPVSSPCQAIKVLTFWSQLNLVSIIMMKLTMLVSCLYTEDLIWQRVAWDFRKVKWFAQSCPVVRRNQGESSIFLNPEPLLVLLLLLFMTCSLLQLLECIFQFPALAILLATGNILLLTLPHPCTQLDTPTSWSLPGSFFPWAPAHSCLFFLRNISLSKGLAQGFSISELLIYYAK